MFTGNAAFRLAVTNFRFDTLSSPQNDVCAGLRGSKSQLYKREFRGCAPPCTRRAAAHVITKNTFAVIAENQSGRELQAKNIKNTNNRTFTVFFK